MPNNISQLVFIIRDEAGCYYFNPATAWIDCRGWKITFEHKNVPRGQGKKQCVKIAKRRNIILPEDSIVRLDAFDVSRRRSFGRQNQRVTIRPFFFDLEGRLSSKNGLIAFGEDSDFYAGVKLPERPSKAA